MEHYVWTLVLGTLLVLLAADITYTLWQKRHYNDLEPLDRFHVLCQLAPCQLQLGEELFFCSCLCSMAVTSQRLLLWVKCRGGHTLVSLNLNQVQALLPDEAEQADSKKKRIPLCIRPNTDEQAFEPHTVALAREDLSDFEFWYGYARNLTCLK